MAKDLAKWAKDKGVKYFMISYTDLFGGQRAKLVPTQAIADMHVLQRDVRFAAVVLDPPRGLRRQAQQPLDRGRGLRARAQFQQLAEQGQRDDHRGGLEIHADAPVFAERGREHVGGQRADHAVRECGAGTDADQGEHVRAAVADRLQAALEERPARPQHDRRAQRELEPAAHAHRQ